MKPIYLICLFILLMATNGHLQAQVNIPEELQQRLQGKNKLKEIMKEVDAYYLRIRLADKVRENKINTIDEEVEPDDDYARWKRWEWYMSSRLAPDGSFVNLSKIFIDAFTDRVQQQDARNSPAGIEGVVTAGAWAFVGPASYGTVWNTTNNISSLPGNGRVDRIGFDPNNESILYAATPAGGLWKSIDHGGSWVNLSNYPSTLGVSGIVVDKANSNIVYILTGDGDSGSGGFVLNAGFARQSAGVLKSTDGGMTWQPTGAWPVGAGVVYYGYNLSQSAADPNILIAATSTGLFRTADGGINWSYIIGGTFNDVKFNPKNGNTVFAAGPGYFYYSNDAGTSWRSANFNISIAGANRIQIGIGQFDTSKVYALCGPVSTLPAAPGFFGLYSSSDGGRNFTRVNNTPNILGNGDNGQDYTDQSVYDLGICVNPSSANTIFTCGTTVWNSTNGGSSFTHNTNYWGGPNGNTHPDMHDIQFSPVNANLLYVCTDGGLYVSSDKGNNWTYLSDGLNCTQWYHITAADRAHLLGGLQDNGIRARTSTTSAFNHVASGDGFCGAYDPNDATKFIVSINTGVNKYSGDGSSFISSFSTSFDQTQYFPFIGRHPTNTNIVFLGREDSIFKSTDEGVNYTKINIGGNRRIVFAPSNPLKIFAASSSKIWRSDDGGSNWTDLTSSSGYPAGSPVITCVAVNPSDANKVMVTFGGFDAANKVIRSTNGGAGWSNDGSTSLPNLPVNCIAINTDNSAYIGTDMGVYYQPSGGSNWLFFSAGLPLVPITDLVIFGGTDQTIYASTFGRGVWYGSLYGACSNSLNLSGTVSGALTYVSGNITSTQSITGGAGTFINYQSGVTTILSPGFLVPNGTRFYAKTGPCNDFPGRTAQPNNNAGSAVPVSILKNNSSNNAGQKMKKNWLMPLEVKNRNNK